MGKKQDCLINFFTPELYRIVLNQTANKLIMISNGEVHEYLNLDPSSSIEVIAARASNVELARLGQAALLMDFGKWLLTWRRVDIGGGENE